MDTELREQLLDRIRTKLAPLGFERREQSFWREAGPVRHCLHIAFINHGDSSDVTADVAVRHHNVEDQLNAARRLSAREKRQTATIGGELGSLSGEGQHRWRLAHTSDIDSVSAGVLIWLERVGQPFFERFSSAAEVLRVLEQDGPEARLICPIPDKRALVRDLFRAQINPGAV